MCGCVADERVRHCLGRFFLFHLGSDNEHAFPHDWYVDSSWVVAGREACIETGGAEGGRCERHSARAAFGVGGDEALENVDEISEPGCLAEHRRQLSDRGAGYDGLTDADIGGERLERLLPVEGVDLAEPLQDDLEERLVRGADSLQRYIPAGATDERAVVDRVAIAGRADVEAIRPLL